MDWLSVKLFGHYDDMDGWLLSILGQNKIRWKVETLCEKETLIHRLERSKMEGQDLFQNEGLRLIWIQGQYWEDKMWDSRDMS